MRQLKTEGIILNTADIFDADRSLLILTKEFGVIRARARGVRKPTSKLAGHLLSFMPTQLELVKSGDNYLIAQAFNVSSYGADQSLTGMTAYRYMQCAEVLAEVISSSLLVAGESHIDIYDGFVFTLERLRESCADKQKKSISWMLVMELIVKSLSALGFKPELENCLLTGQKIGNVPLAWSSQLGGVILTSAISPHDNQGAASIIKLDNPRSILVMRQFMRPQFVAEHLSISEPIQLEVKQIVLDFAQYQIGKPLRSYQVSTLLL